MALKGELLSADLSNVFQMLAMNGKRGLLTVQDRVNPVARRRFFLDGQAVLLGEPISQRPSLPLLVEMGRVTYEQYASALQRARRFNSDTLGTKSGSARHRGPIRRSRRGMCSILAA